MKRIAAILSALLMAACATPTGPAPDAVSLDAGLTPLDIIHGERNIELLVNILVGKWDTIQQLPGYGDSTPMRLRIARIWPERTDGYWLYWEYVNPADERLVLRQRVFHFVREGLLLHAPMYRLPGDSLAYAGEWRKPHPFESLKPGSLREAEGCRTEWTLQFETYFAAGTEGDACRGDNPKVSNEHWEFALGPTSMRTWIIGQDSAGNQVEGLTLPSEFRKKSGNLI